MYRLGHFNAQVGKEVKGYESITGHREREDIKIFGIQKEKH
jgi:hypothetical protein